MIIFLEGWRMFINFFILQTCAQHGACWELSTGTHLVNPMVVDLDIPGNGLRKSLARGSQSPTLPTKNGCSEEMKGAESIGSQDPIIQLQLTQVVFLGVVAFGPSPISWAIRSVPRCVSVVFHSVWRWCSIRLRQMRMVVMVVLVLVVICAWSRWWTMRNHKDIGFIHDISKWPFIWSASRYGLNRWWWCDFSRMKLALWPFTSISFYINTLTCTNVLDT